MKIGIVEDDPNSVNIIQDFLLRFQRESGENFSICTFSDGDEITENYAFDCEILLMDIEMKRIDGLTAASYIRKIDKDVLIIFITNSPQYAVRGYTVNALSYLLKPVSYFCFSETLTKAIRILKRNMGNYILLHMKGQIIRVCSKDIYYVESVKHQLIVHTAQGDYTVLNSLKNFEKEAGKNFIRCNNCFLINLKYLTEIRENDAVVGGTPLTISRSRRKNLIESFTKYCGGINLDDC